MRLQSIIHNNNHNFIIFFRLSVPLSQANNRNNENNNAGEPNNHSNDNNNARGPNNVNNDNILLVTVTTGEFYHQNMLNISLK